MKIHKSIKYSIVAQKRQERLNYPPLMPLKFVVTCFELVCNLEPSHLISSICKLALWLSSFQETVPENKPKRWLKADYLNEKQYHAKQSQKCESNKNNIQSLGQMIFKKILSSSPTSKRRNRFNTIEHKGGDTHKNS